MLALNDELLFYFSAPLDPARVTPDSFEILLLDGEGQAQRDPFGNVKRVRGDIEVDAYRIRFRPKVPLAPDLQDGGFLPGRSYYVRIAGFPRPDCLCSLDGRPLERSASFPFRTAPRDSDQLFRSLSRARLFVPVGWFSGVDRGFVQFGSDGSHESIRGLSRDRSWIFVFNAPIRPDRLREGSVYLNPKMIGDPEVLPVGLRLLSVEGARRRLQEVGIRLPYETEFADGSLLEILPPEAVRSERLGSVGFFWLVFRRDADFVLRDYADRPLVAPQLDPTEDSWRFLVLLGE